MARKTALRARGLFSVSDSVARTALRVSTRTEGLVYKLTQIVQPASFVIS